MKYMLLIYDDEKSFGSISKAETEQMIGEYQKFTASIQASSNYQASSRLQPTSAATAVRIRDGKRLVTDGPFAETREQLGGYYLIEAKDLDEAIAIAARVPSARRGTVEVRPLFQVGAPATA